jgi:hypothetical protein
MTQPLKTYTVLFAEDIPHYGGVDIESRNDAEALCLARSFDTDRVSYYEGCWDGAVCKRIVSIEGADGKIIAHDIPLDEYSLRHGGQADRALCEAASDLLEVVRYTDEILSGFKPDALRNLGLDVLFEKARSSLAKTTPN